MPILLSTDYFEPVDLEPPALVSVHAYWDAVRDGLVGPPRQSFRLERLPPEIISSMAMVDFLGPPIDYYYRFFGTRMVDIAGQDLTGKAYFADRIVGYGFVNAEIFPKMIERRAPICTRIRWVSMKGFEMTTTTIRLPLSDDGDRITAASRPIGSTGGSTIDGRADHRASRRNIRSGMYRDVRDQKFAYIVAKEFLDIAALEEPGLIVSLAYWEQTRDGRVGPSVAMFRLERLPSDVIPCTAPVPRCST